MSARRIAPTVLLTGFAPFDGDARNPSIDAARALRGRRIAGHRVVVRELPVEFRASLTLLRRAIREVRPVLVVCVGLASSRDAISLERIAINIDDARIPDNAGRQPVDTPVVPGGPDAYFSTLPIKAIHASLREAGIPVEVSQTAGTFVCNHVFYGLMHALRRRPRVRAGFIHVPRAAGMAASAGRAAVPLPVLVGALRRAIHVSIVTNDDARIAAGAID